MAKTCGVKGCNGPAITYIEPKKLWLCQEHWVKHLRDTNAARRQAGERRRAVASEAPRPEVIEVAEDE